MLKQQRADHVRRRLEELYPETPIPLDHKDAYTLLIAVLLSAQCTDVRVNLVTPALKGRCLPLDSNAKLSGGFRGDVPRKTGDEVFQASQVTHVGKRARRDGRFG